MSNPYSTAHGYSLGVAVRLPSDDEDRCHHTKADEPRPKYVYCRECRTKLVQTATQKRGYCSGCKPLDILRTFT